MNEFTKAPPPPPTLPGSYVSEGSKRALAPIDSPRVKPDPHHWTREAEWQINDGAVLLVDLDPRDGLGRRLKDLLGPDIAETVPKAVLTNEELVAFRHAETVVRRATGLHSTLVKKYNVSDDWYVARPVDFVVWLVTSSPIDIPAWMTALLPDHARAATTRAPEVLEPGERTTLRKLAAYFAKRYDYDPNAEKSDATAKVRQELARVGIALDDKTIRKLLKLGSGEESR